MVLPVVKLGILALKTISKPLANAVKRRASSHPKFRESIIGMAQFYHKLNVNLQRRLYGHATNVDIKPLNEAAAVATAADLMGEVVIFGVAGALVVFEVSRSAISESRKEEARKQALEALRRKDEELLQELEETKKRILELENSLKGSWFPVIPKPKPSDQPRLASQSEAQQTITSDATREKSAAT